MAVLALAACGTGPEPPRAATTTTTTAPSTSTTAAGTTTTTTGCVEAWPLRRRLASLLVVGVDPTGPAAATALVRDQHVGGLFVGGDATGLLTSGALQDLRAGAPAGLLVAVDEEGGRVQRVEGLDGEAPSAREMARTLDPAGIEALAARRGRVMAAHGVTVDLAPVVDVSAQADGEVVGDRSFSDDPAIVTASARAWADGLLAAGVVPVLKHFPGHGRAAGDSHAGPAVTPPLAEMDADLAPYRALLPALGDRVAVMLGHLDVPGLTEDGVPASLSPAAVRLLRDDLGFGGVVMTDDLGSMAAVTSRFGAGEAAERALAAGVDLLLYAAVDVPGLLDHLEGAVAAGRLAAPSVDAAVARRLALLGLDPCRISVPGA